MHCIAIVEIIGLEYEQTHQASIRTWQRDTV